MAHSGNCGANGNNLTWILDDTGLLTISGTGEMADWTYNSISLPWYDYKSNIKTVIIEDGVTRVGDYAFDRSGLTSVTIPDSVISIGESAFSGCLNLTSVTIPNNVTTIEEYAFDSSGLTSVIIGNSVTTIGSYAFYNCLFTELNIPDSVENLGGFVFSWCPNLKNATIGKNHAFDTSLFDGCQNLINIKANENNENYSSIDGVLFDKNLTVLYDYPQGRKNDTYNIPDTVITIGWEAFNNCISLTQIIIPSSVTSISRWAFDGCDSLGIVYYNGTRESWENISISENNEPLVSSVIQTLEKRGQCGDNLTYEITCQLQEDVVYYEINIEGAGDMYDYSAETMPWQEYCENIEYVNIYGNITRIGAHAFEGCSNLQEIISYDAYEDVYYRTVSVGNAACAGCKNLQNFTFDCISIGERAFYHCQSLNVIYVSNSLTTIGSSAFFGCENLSYFTIPNGVTIIESSTFQGCKALKQIIIPENITTIGNYAFKGCNSLKNIDIPNGVINIGEEAFSDCKNLVAIKVKENNPNYVSNNDILFNKNLTLLIQYPIGKIDNEYTIPNNVTNIGKGAFYGSINLETITMFNKVTIIGEGAFYNCVNLTQIYYDVTKEECNNIDIGIENDSLISATIYFLIKKGQCGDNLTYELNSVLLDEVENNQLVISGTGDMYNYTNVNTTPWYEYCDSINSIVLSNKMKSIGNYAFSNFVDLTSIELPNSLISIGNNAFRSCVNLINITIPDSVTSIGEEVFANCENLVNATLSKNMTEIGIGAFYSCSNLISIEIPTNVTSIADNVFFNCTNLQEIKLSNNIISIGDSSFEGCVALTEIEIPDGVTSIGAWAFGSCSILTNIIIPNSITILHNTAFNNCTNLIVYYKGAEWNWNEITEIRADDNITIYFSKGYCGKNGDNLIWEFDMIDTLTISGDGDMADYSFIREPDHFPINTAPWVNYRTKIEIVTIENGVTSIGSYAFYQVYGNLTEIKMPNSIVSIGYRAFYDCSSLTKVTMSDNLINIGDSAFNSCNSLTSIEIPDGVTSIGSLVFAHCDELTSIVIGNNVTNINTNAFYNCINLISFSCKSKKANVVKGAFEGCTNLIKETNGKKYIINEATNKQWLIEQTLTTSTSEIDNDIELLCEHSVSFSDVGSVVIVTLPLSLLSVSDKSFILNEQINDMEFICENPNVFLGELGIVDNNLN